MNLNRSWLAPLLCLAMPAIMLGGCAGKHENPAQVAKRAEIHFQLGVDAINRGNLPKAFDELLTAEKLDPKRADIQAMLGYAWMLRGDMDKAETWFKRAVRHHPDSSIWTNYGVLMLRMKKPKRAEEYFRKALDDPRYPHPDIAYIDLGDALLMQGRFNEAIAAYRQARAINPLQEFSRLKEADAYLRYDRPAYARALYETILRDKPGYRPALEALIALLRKEGDMAEVRARLEEFRKRTSNPLDKAWASDELRKLDEAK